MNGQYLKIFSYICSTLHCAFECTSRHSGAVVNAVELHARGPGFNTHPCHLVYSIILFLMAKSLIHLFLQEFNITIKYSFKIFLLFQIIFVFKQVTWAMSLDMLVFFLGRQSSSLIRLRMKMYCFKA